MSTSGTDTESESASRKVTQIASIFGKRAKFKKIKSKKLQKSSFNESEDDLLNNIRLRHVVEF